MDGPWWQLLIMLVIIAGLLAGILAAFALPLAAGRTMRNKGYPPLATGLIALSSVALGYWLDDSLFDTLGGKSLGFVVGFAAFLLGTPLLMAAIAFALPWRGQRRPGERATRFPLHIVLYAMAALGAAGTLALLSLPFLVGATVPNDLLGTVLAPLLAVTTGLMVAARRVRTQMRSPRRLAEAMQADRRQAVLYLREFAYERQPFVRGSLSALQPYLERSQRWVPPFLLPEWVTELTVTFEEYLIAAVERSLGPLVALGSPEDYLQPLGAAREYAADDHWQQRFEQLAADASAVLLVPGTSNHLTWELATLLRRGHADKLFIMIGPLTFVESSLWKLGVLYGWKRAQWRVYRQLMAACGYTLPESCPRPCSVMGFDKSGCATLVSDGWATSPQAFVHAIETHLVQQGQRAKVSVPLLDLTLGEGVGVALEQTQKAMERLGLAESSSLRREVLLILGLLFFQGVLIVSTFEMVPALQSHAFGFDGSGETYFALTAASGALAGALCVGTGARFNAAMAGAVAGLGALGALTFGLGLANSADKSLFGLLELLGVLPGLGLFLLIDKGYAGETAPPTLHTMPAPSTAVTWQLVLNYADTMDTLSRSLNQIGPWTWNLRRNARYGSYLTCRPQKGVRVRIHRSHSQCLALLQVDHDSPATREMIDRAFAKLLRTAGIEGLNMLS